jgi:type IV secretory pathway TrbF-like protein
MEVHDEVGSSVLTDASRRYVVWRGELHRRERLVIEVDRAGKAVVIKSSESDYAASLKEKLQSRSRSR